MTQKDLLYLEDAIEHEKCIIKICNEALNELEKGDLSSFMDEQIIIHENLKNKLMTFLKECANE